MRRFKVGDKVKTRKPSRGLAYGNHMYDKTGVIERITGSRSPLFYITGLAQPFFTSELISLGNEYKVYMRKE